MRFETLILVLNVYICKTDNLTKLTQVLRELGAVDEAGDIKIKCLPRANYRALLQFIQNETKS